MSRPPINSSPSIHAYHDNAGSARISAASELDRQESRTRRMTYVQPMELHTPHFAAPWASMPSTPWRCLTDNGPDVDMENLEHIQVEDNQSLFSEVNENPSGNQDGRYKENQGSNFRVHHSRSRSVPMASSPIALLVRKSAENLCGISDTVQSSERNLHAAEKNYLFHNVRQEATTPTRKQRHELISEIPQTSLCEDNVQVQSVDSETPIGPAAPTLNRLAKEPLTPNCGQHAFPSFEDYLPESSYVPYVGIQKPCPGIPVIGGDPKVMKAIQNKLLDPKIQCTYNITREKRNEFETPKPQYLANPTALRLLRGSKGNGILGEAAMPLSPIPVTIRNKRHVSPSSMDVGPYSRSRRRISSLSTPSQYAPTKTLLCAADYGPAQYSPSQKQSWSHFDWVHFEDAFAIATDSATVISEATKATFRTTDDSNSSFLENSPGSSLMFLSVENLEVPVGYKLGYKDEKRIFPNRIIEAAENTLYDSESEDQENDAVPGFSYPNGNSPHSVALYPRCRPEIDECDRIESRRYVPTNKDCTKIKVRVWQDGWVYTGTSKQNEAKDLLWNLIPISSDPEVVQADHEYQKLKKTAMLKENEAFSFRF